MRNRARTVLAITALTCLLPALGHADVTPYSQDFEALVQIDPDALANDGWLVFGNVWDPTRTTYLYGYGPFPAPNHEFAFSQIDVFQGGVEQGLQQLVVFNDYNNVDHALGNRIESNVYREWTVGAANVGQTWIFEYQAKLGNIEGASIAAAFIKTIDPSSGFALTNFITQDMTATPVTWQGYSLSITIDASLEGQLLQIGFLSEASFYEGSGIFYDNLVFRLQDPTGVTADGTLIGARLQQNYPNPFNPQTRIEFALDRPGTAEVSVFDLAGRKVATLHQGELGVGKHSVIWNGRTDSGAKAASGRYSYVLKTASGQVSRSMVLLK